ncbi:hypothetical protein CP97_05485 [Aurantiacibacter atlanticus]|uniref:Uncharacterized protein n=1 Tax=Aurantiacibacter atlanticus TaxID=1648404 RepID=A0A0H4VER9_9SPHN|nr:hypothetical protein CP97_05485 [Aurantiacibacter atlanticus]
MQRSWSANRRIDQSKFDNDAALDLAGFKIRENIVDVLQPGLADARLDRPSFANCTASARSLRLPTIDPRMVIRFSTTSNIGVGNSPGGSPVKAMVPFLRTIFRACANAGTETAVTSTP